MLIVLITTSEKLKISQVAISTYLHLRMQHQIQVLSRSIRTPIMNDTRHPTQMEFKEVKHITDLLESVS